MDNPDHHYALVLEDDGDFIVFKSWNGKRWVEWTRWLIPGTEFGE